MESKFVLYDCQIGERLRYFRKRRGLTQSSLAARLKISPQQLQKYEIGKNRISASRLKHIAEILDIPAHHFFIDTNDISPKDKKIFNESDNNVGKLVYYYSLIRSEKLKKLLINSSAIYVENGM